MDTMILGVVLILGIGFLAVVLIAKGAIEAVSESAKRESESAALAIQKFHSASQAAALHATMVKNERIVEAELNLEAERLRFGNPDKDTAPATSRYYDPSHIGASNTQSDELRTVNASGTGVD